MIASTQARERVAAENSKKKAQIAELQQFVSRFSANASKSKQATSRARQIDKIVLEDIKPSSRQNPFIRFNQEKKLHRVALEVKGLAHAYEKDHFLFENATLLDRKSTRLNSSHVRISYAVFCLKKKKSKLRMRPRQREDGCFGGSGFGVVGGGVWQGVEVDEWLSVLGRWTGRWTSWCAGGVRWA